METLLNFLGNAPAVTAAGVAIAVLLLAFWPAAGAIWIRILPAVRQVPVIVRALRDVSIPGDLKEEAAITKTLREAGTIQAAVINASGGRAALRRVVRKEARKLLSGDGIDRSTKF